MLATLRRLGSLDGVIPPTLRIAFDGVMCCPSLYLARLAPSLLARPSLRTVALEACVTSCSARRAAPRRLAALWYLRIAAPGPFEALSPFSIRETAPLPEVAEPAFSGHEGRGVGLGTTVRSLAVGMPLLFLRSIG